MAWHLCGSLRVFALILLLQVASCGSVQAANVEDNLEVDREVTCLRENVDLLRKCLDPAAVTSATPGSTSLDYVHRWTQFIHGTAQCVYGVNLTGPSVKSAAAGTFLLSSCFGAFKDILRDFENWTALAYNVTVVDRKQYMAQRYRISGQQLPSAEDPGPYDFWMVSAEVFGVPEADGVFVDTTLLLENEMFHVSDIPLAWRAAMSSAAANSYHAIPVAVLPSHLFYRADLFHKFNISVPHTWDDVIDILLKYGNQDLDEEGSTEYGICFESSADCGAYGNTVLYILASIIQLRGHVDGVAFDPENLKLLMSGEALREALRIFSTLHRFSIPDNTSCFAMYYTYHAHGRCLMTIGYPLAYKVGSHGTISTPLKGNLRTAALPGSARVLDRASGHLVRCTAELCPYAKLVDRPGTNATELVNKPIIFDSVSFAINKFAPLHRQSAAYMMIMNLLSPSRHRQLVLSLTELGPTLNCELDPAMWTAAGYELNNTRSYLSEYQHTIQDPNIFFEMRFPGAFEIQDLLSRLVWSVVWGHVAFDDAEAQFEAGVAGVIAANSGHATLLHWYRKSLGIISITAQPPQAPESLAVSSKGYHLRLRLLEVLVPIAGTLMVIALGICSWMLHQRLRPMVMENCNAPGPGMVVLCVTDIQDSTALWETLSADVCQRAVQLHHAAIRQHVTRCNGYESATEGDSFILAFQQVTDCSKFALQIQEAFMDLEWPLELLESEFASSLWVYRDMAALMQPWLHKACSANVRTLLQSQRPNEQQQQSENQERQRQQQQQKAARHRKLQQQQLPLLSPGIFSGLAMQQRQSVQPKRNSLQLPLQQQQQQYETSPPSQSLTLSPDAAEKQGPITPIAQSLIFSSQSPVENCSSKGTHPQRTSRTTSLWCPPPFPPPAGAAGNTIPAAFAPGCPEVMMALTEAPSYELTQDVTTGLLDMTEPTLTVVNSSVTFSGGNPFHISNATAVALPKAAVISTVDEGVPPNPSHPVITTHRLPHRVSLTTDMHAVKPTYASDHHHTFPFYDEDIEAGSETEQVKFENIEREHEHVMSCAVAQNRFIRGTPLNTRARASRYLQLFSDRASNSNTYCQDRFSRSSATFGNPSSASHIFTDQTSHQLAEQGEEVNGKSCMTFQTLLREAFPPVDGAAPQESIQQVFRGLRVRVGYHVGELRAADVRVNRASHRTIYSGPIIQLAKAISDAGRGGQITLSAAVLAALDLPALGREAGNTVVLHSGCHVLKEGSPDVELYSLFSRRLLPRLAYLCTPRSIQQRVPGIVSAPLGMLTMAVSQADEQCTWIMDSAASYYNTVRGIAQDLAIQGTGYLMPINVGALNAAVFQDPAEAIRWVLALHQQARMITVDFLPDSWGEKQKVKYALEQAPKMRAGVEMGLLEGGITFDGRMSYRGKTCKRTVCLAAHAPWNEVLVSLRVATAVLSVAGSDEQVQITDMEAAARKLKERCDSRAQKSERELSAHKKLLKATMHSQYRGSSSGGGRLRKSNCGGTCSSGIIAFTQAVSGMQLQPPLSTAAGRYYGTIPAGAGSSYNSSPRSVGASGATTGTAGATLLGPARIKSLLQQGPPTQRFERNDADQPRLQHIQAQSHRETGETRMLRMPTSPLIMNTAASCHSGNNCIPPRSLLGRRLLSTTLHLLSPSPSMSHDATYQPSPSPMLPLSPSHDQQQQQQPATAPESPADQRLKQLAGESQRNKALLRLLDLGTTDTWSTMSSPCQTGTGATDQQLGNNGSGGTHSDASGAFVKHAGAAWIGSSPRARPAAAAAAAARQSGPTTGSLLPSKLATGALDVDKMMPESPPLESSSDPQPAELLLGCCTGARDVGAAGLDSVHADNPVSITAALEGIASGGGPHPGLEADNNIISEARSSYFGMPPVSFAAAGGMHQQLPEDRPVLTTGDPAVMFGTHADSDCFPCGGRGGGEDLLLTLSPRLYKAAVMAPSAAALAVEPEAAEVATGSGGASHHVTGSVFTTSHAMTPFRQSLLSTMPMAIDTFDSMPRAARNSNQMTDTGDDELAASLAARQASRPQPTVPIAITQNLANREAHDRRTQHGAYLRHSCGAPVIPPRRFGDLEEHSGGDNSSNYDNNGCDGCTQSDEGGTENSTAGKVEPSSAAGLMPNLRLHFMDVRLVPFRGKHMTACLARYQQQRREDPK